MTLKNDQTSTQSLTTDVCTNDENLGKFTFTDKLRDAGLRPTRQRNALAQLLFNKGDRHLSAEDLFEEAKQANIAISLATIYNTLNQFSDAGLLRTISIDSTKIYYDTNIGDHHHFFLEDSETLIDIPNDYLQVQNLPSAPEGMEINCVDVIVRLRRVKT